MTRFPRNSVQDRPGRLKLLLRRHRWLVSRLAVGSGLVLVASVAIIAGHRSHERSVATARERFGNATASAGLRIKDVVITGRQNTPESLLRAALGVKPGDPILGLSVADARARIESLSWVEHATVERRLPATVVVGLEERRPFAIWQNGGKFTLIDREGQVVADGDLARFNTLPLVVGPGAPVSAAPLIDALNARPALMARVVAAVRIGERRWNLRLHGGMDVLLPEGAETAALDRLGTLQTDQALLDRPLQVVDMRLPDRLVIRPLPSADPQSVDGMPLPPSPPPVPPDGKKPT
ncbi:MAG: FtsQ-type POTRA domain-containing protein [Acetobacteraceae bacterium]|nr:FtsQ-type POTRA domain-containing protein [Acetobacteraceae bacterium]